MRVLAFCLPLPFAYLMQPSPLQWQRADWLGCLLTSSSVAPQNSQQIMHVQRNEGRCSDLAFFFFFFFLSVPSVRFSAFRLCSSSLSLALSEEGCSEVSLEVLAASASFILPDPLS